MKFFDNLTIPRKLILALGLMLVSVLSVNAVIHFKSSEIQQTTKWTDHTAEVIAATNLALGAMVDQETGLRGFLLSGEDKFLDPYRSGVATFDKALAQAKQLTSDNAAQQQRYGEMQKFGETWRKDVAEPAIALMAKPETREAGRQIEIGGAGKVSMDGLRAKVAEIIGVESALSVTRKQAQEAAFDLTATVIYGGTALNVLIALAIGFLLTRTVARPIGIVSAKLATLATPVATGRRDEIGQMEGSALAVENAFRDVSTVLTAVSIGDLSQTIERNYGGLSQEVSENLKRMTGNLQATAALANAISNGDLTVEAKRLSDKDTLGIALENMVAKLRAIVIQAIQAAENVSSGSQELSASAEQLSQGSTEQASSTEEASSSMEEMTANVKQNADNASTTEKIAAQSAKDAEASGVAVGRAVDAMQTIAAKITIVQEIARQTDLLALNAAVEAARAGEHGKGFAVVASEVRKLAERSQAAAAEIGTLSTDTVKVAQEAGSMLAKLVPDIRKTAELVEEITAACREQDVGSTQINQAIQQLDKVTQQNAAASEQVSATSEELAAQAEQLQATIAFFRLEDGAVHKPAAQPVVIDKAVKQLRGKATAMAVAVQPRTSQPKASAAASARSPRKVANGGFAFDMDGGEDQQDAAFHRA
jgi:methyl-accepting chemotaxis protein